MKIKELVQITARAIKIHCFEEYSSSYDDYTTETKEGLDDKEVSMIDCVNVQELNVYYID